jgi:hypothetical protein
MLASVLATSPFGVLVLIAGIVDWACAVALAKLIASRRLSIQFVTGEKEKLTDEWQLA